jgi:hypothetical protein
MIAWLEANNRQTEWIEHVAPAATA